MKEQILEIIIPQETLEEAAKRLYQYQSENPPYTIITPIAKIEGFIEGAKWQAERMYSEEDMKLSFETGRNFQLTGEDNFNELIEQFKKK